MKIIEFRSLPPSQQLIVATSLIETNKLKPDVQALIRFILKNTLLCIMGGDKLLACSGYKNLRGKIRLSIIKNYPIPDEFLYRIKNFTVKEKGWTYRSEDCPKEALVIINKAIDKRLGYYKLFSLISKTNARMIKSAENRGFIKMLEISSPNSGRPLIVLYRR